MKEGKTDIQNYYCNLHVKSYSIASDLPGMHGIPRASASSWGICQIGLAPDLTSSSLMILRTMLLKVRDERR